MKEKGIKYDGEKLRYDLVPAEQHADVAKVLTFGLKKYSVDNWKYVPNGKLRYIAAAFRHLWARAWGEVLDKESGLPHVAHAICCLYFVGWFDAQPRIHNKKVYISGPITGIKDYNKPAFDEASEELEKHGFVPVNPLVLSVVSKKKTHGDYMRDDIKAMTDCDAVYLLPGWELSRGARDEVYMAKAMDIPVYVSLLSLIQKEAK